MPIYDYIVVGGGISGLYMTYKLSQTGKSILLVESTNRLGGRILTTKEKNLQFELGAARISSKHTKMMSLINELDLKDDLIKLPDKVTYKIKGPKVNFHNLVKEVQEKSKLYTRKYLENVSLHQLCIDILGEEMTEYFKDSLGYDSEFTNFQAYMALKIFKKDLFSKCDYYVLKNGLSSVTDTIATLLEDNEDVTIKLECSVTDLGKNFIQIDKKKIYGQRIICALPYQAVIKLPKLKDLECIQGVQPVPLIRIYAQYPKDKNGKVWFHGLHRTITDNYIRHIIPIDYETGLIMISYTDGELANMWSQLDKLGKKTLVERLHKQVKKVLNKDPPDPIMISTRYWSGGVHMWKPGYNVKETYETLLKPFPKENIYMINESFSKHQSWVEGCLDMAYDVIELLDEKFSRGKGKGGAKKRKKGDKKKNKRVSNVFTIEQVLKKRNWIVLDIKKQLRIYDVSKWMNDHPGGADNLRKGIKANKHYVDSDKYPDSPIKLFKQIGAHSSSRVIQKMLLKAHDKIKYIGIMKKV